MDSTTTRKPCSPDASREGELEHALSLLRSGSEPAAVVEALSRRLTNRLLHLPIKSLASAG